MKTYDVVIEVRNIQAKDEEEAKRRALGLITSLSSTDIKVETFEKRTIDDLVKLYGMTKIAHKMFTEGLFSLAEVKVKGEKGSVMAVDKGKGDDLNGTTGELVGSSQGGGEE